jgi:hypothetical protein
MRRLALGCAALLASSALQAQDMPTPTIPAGMQNPQAMLKAMEAAQAAAKQPGDEALSCAQLEKKVIAAVQDPAYQAHLQAAGANAQKDIAASQISQSEIAKRAAATAAAASVPGASMGHMVASAAENQALVAQGQARLQSMMIQSQAAMTFMPTIMRAQRLIELGVAKKCPWTGAAAASLGTPATVESPNR